MFALPLQMWSVINDASPMNKSPSVAAKKAPTPERERVSLVLPVSLKAALLAQAHAERRTLNGQCEVLLVKCLREEGVQV